MKYVMLTTRELPALVKISCVALLLEIDGQGAITREVGVSAAGEIIHCAPAHEPLFFPTTGEIIARFLWSKLEPGDFVAAWDASLT